MQTQSGTWADKTGIRLLRHWETALLLAIVLYIACMIAYLLLPSPAATLTLKPLTGAHLATAVATESPGASELSGVDSEKPEASAKRSRRFHTLRKPAKPPVLNMNTASLSQLQLLPGIGPKMAQRIVEYRKASGPFREPSQIMEVNGIGPKKFEKLKPYLRL